LRSEIKKQSFVKYFYAGFLGEAELGDDPEANASLFVSLLGKIKTFMI
jgi:hypothetical protein